LANIHRSPERVLQRLSLQMSVEAEAQGRRIQGVVKPSPERNWSRGWRHWSVPSISSIPSVRSVPCIWSVWSVSSVSSMPDSRGIWPSWELSLCDAQAGPCAFPSSSRKRLVRKGFPQVQILENQSASALPAASRAHQAGKPLRETPPHPDHLPPSSSACSRRWWCRPRSAKSWEHSLSSWPAPWSAVSSSTFAVARWWQKLPMRASMGESAKISKRRSERSEVHCQGARGVHGSRPGPFAAH